MSGYHGKGLKRKWGAHKSRWSPEVRVWNRDFLPAIAIAKKPEKPPKEKPPEPPPPPKPGWLDPETYERLLRLREGLA